LNPIDADPGAADYGSLVHKALERFFADTPDLPPPAAEARLLEIGEKVFADVLVRPSVRTFWWPRFRAIAAWVAAQEADRRPRVARTLCEIDGTLEIAAPGGPFRLHARADRLDVLTDGSLALIDYKTGTVPKSAEIAAGYSPQMPLEAAIAAAGGFPQVGAATVSEVLFWSLKGGDAGGKQRPIGDDPAALAEAALAGLAALVAAFDDSATPYEARPHPDMAPRFSEVLHLARVKEWATGEESEE
jgi:ATP-dependent helicase/nuclease subunit B